MANPEYRIEQYRHPDEFPGDVRSLFDMAEADDIEFGATWFANLIDTVFGREGPALFYVLWRGDCVLIALPLLLVRRRLGCELHALGNFYTSRYGPPVAAEASAADFRVLLDGIRARHPGLRCLNLAPVDAQAPSTILLRAALSESSFVCFDYFRFINWFLNINTGWEAYLAGREGKLRTTLKRKLSKLQTDGGGLEIVTGGLELESAIADYQSVYATSWKKPEPFPDFVPGLLRAAAARGWLRLGIARLEGRAIAAQIWLIHQGRAGIFKLAYNEADKAYSPGSLLTARLMQQAMEQDHVNQVDYLIGDDPYKKVWMADSRSRIGLLGFNLRSLGGMLGALREWLASRSKPLRTSLRGMPGA